MSLCGCVHGAGTQICTGLGLDMCSLHRGAPEIQRSKSLALLALTGQLDGNCCGCTLHGGRRACRPAHDVLKGCHTAHSRPAFCCLTASSQRMPGCRCRTCRRESWFRKIDRAGRRADDSSGQRRVQGFWLLNCWLTAYALLQVSDLPSRELVPGDLVELHVGDKVPADVRMTVLKTATLRAEQASLTGESVAVLKSTDAVHDEDCELQAGPAVTSCASACISCCAQG